MHKVPSWRQIGPLPGQISNLHTDAPLSVGICPDHRLSGFFGHLGPLTGGANCWPTGLSGGASRRVGRAQTPPWWPWAERLGVVTLDSLNHAYSDVVGPGHTDAFELVQ